MSIPTVNSRAVLTRALVASFDDTLPPSSFLKSLFTPRVEMTKDVYIEVVRNFEAIAFDVARFSDGKLNEFSTSTEKEFLPPFYHEYHVLNNHRLYDVAIAANGAGGSMVQLARAASNNMSKLRYKIERAIEKQCSEVLEFGTVTLADSSVIDYNRQAGSLVANAVGNTWATGTVSPYDVMEAGGTFIRKEGKYGGSTFNVILGETAMQDFLKNDIVLARNDIKHFKLDNIMSPSMSSEGAVYHGSVSCGPYMMNLWTYPQYYDLAGTSTPYINPKKVIIVPTTTNFVLAYAAVPQLIGANGSIPQSGAYLLQEFIDERRTAHEMHIKSAPLAIPVAVDQIYTVQVVA